MVDCITMMDGDGRIADNVPMRIEVMHMDFVSTISELPGNVRSYKTGPETVNDSHARARTGFHFGLTVRCFDAGFVRCLD